jgi:hypothetical protein
LLVSEYGGAAVLEAIDVAGRRLRGISPGHSASASSTGGGVSDLNQVSLLTAMVELFSLPDGSSLWRCVR